MIWCQVRSCRRELDDTAQAAGVFASAATRRAFNISAHIHKLTRAAVTSVLTHDVSAFPVATRFLQTHATTPFLTVATVEAALHALASNSSHDSLFSVTPIRVRLWDAGGSAVNHDPSVLLRTQECVC